MGSPNLDRTTRNDPKPTRIPAAVLPGPVSINIIDGGAMHGLCELFAERAGLKKVSMDFTALKHVLADIRRAENMCVASNSFVFLATDPTSESQRRFQTALQTVGFEVDAVDFRSVFPSLPPGRSREKDAPAPEVSLAARLSYVVGLQARHRAVELMVVTHDFALAGALMDLALRGADSRIAVVFFDNQLDHRWRSHGIFTKVPLKRTSGRCLIEFFDLDKYAQQLVGISLPHLSAIEPEGGTTVLKKL